MRVQVTLTLPADLWREARAAAVRQGTSASRVIETLLQAWLRNAPDPPAHNTHDSALAASEPIVAFLLEQQYYAAPISHTVKLVAKRTRQHESVIKHRLSELTEQGIVQVWVDEDGKYHKWLGLEEMVRLNPARFPWPGSEPRTTAT